MPAGSGLRCTEETCRLGNSIFALAGIGLVFDDTLKDRDRLFGLAAANQRHGKVEVGVEIAPARDLVLGNRRLELVIARRRVGPAALRGLRDGDALIGFGMNRGIDPAAHKNVERDFGQPLCVLVAALCLHDVGKDQHRVRGLWAINALHAQEVDQRAADLEFRTRSACSDGTARARASAEFGRYLLRLRRVAAGSACDARFSRTPQGL